MITLPPVKKCSGLNQERNLHRSNTVIIMDYGLIFELKNVLMVDLFQLLSEVEWCGLLWCFYQLFDSHSDGTHSLQSIHCWDTDAETHFYKPDEETNSSWSWMTWGGAHFQHTLIFGLNYLFNVLKKMATTGNKEAFKILCFTQMDIQCCFIDLCSDVIVRLVFRSEWWPVLEMLFWVL